MSSPDAQHLPDVAIECATDLALWYQRNARPLPWRETKDPYKIWISEAMLQQTRVDQATGYYFRFLNVFPTLQDLAEAPLDTVLKQWEGLGYYARARNLHKAAKLAHSRFGQVPDEYEALLDLPGIGPYTAAAIASIAFNQPYAVLDGNVIRVLARVFAIDSDIRNTSTRTRLQTIADALLDTQKPGAHNESIMELGATLCLPKSPDCNNCPLISCCLAYKNGEVNRMPFKGRKAPIPHYTVVIGLIRDKQNRLLITRRPNHVMLGGLWEFPGGKCKPGEQLADALRRELKEELEVEVQVGKHVFQTRHAYSHFRITLHAFQCRIVRGTPKPNGGIPAIWVNSDDLDQYAFPRANRKLIDTLFFAKLRS